MNIVIKDINDIVEERKQIPKFQQDVAIGKYLIDQFQFLRLFISGALTHENVQIADSFYQSQNKMLYASELSSESEIEIVAYNNRKVVFAVLNFFKF